jgi:hypothetical protein
MCFIEANHVKVEFICSIKVAVQCMNEYSQLWIHETKNWGSYIYTSFKARYKWLLDSSFITYKLHYLLYLNTNPPLPHFPVFLCIHVITVIRTACVCSRTQWNKSNVRHSDTLESVPSIASSYMGCIRIADSPGPAHMSTEHIIHPCTHCVIASPTHLRLS